MKFIPIIGIILLFGIYISQQNNNISTENQIMENKPFMEKIIDTWKSLVDSFYFSDILTLMITIILLMTIYTGYQYWLKDMKYIRKNNKLLEKLVYVIMVIIFVNNHIKMNSAIGKFVDWGLFLLFLYLVLAGTWFLMKTINNINLASDLYCWVLRLLGGVFIFFGFILLMSSSLTLVFDNSDMAFNNIYWILSICIILLGVFSEFRSFRRYPMVGIWQ